MWFCGGLDSRTGFPTYGCVEIEDANFTMQPPTFMTQGLEALVDESCLSSWYDNYGDNIQPTTERATLVQAKRSSNGAGLMSYGLNQDFSGIDSNVCFLTEQQYQQNLEKAPEASRRHLSPSSSFQSNTQQFSINSEHLLESMPNLHLLPQEVLDCLQNPASEAVLGTPVNVGWITEEEGKLIKKECNTPSRRKESVQSFVSPPVRAPVPANRHLNSELTHVAQFADVTGAFHSGLSQRLQPSKLHSTFPSVLRPPKRTTFRAPTSKLTSEQNLLRKAKVARYLEKRKRRNWNHTIRYASRKAYAENRPRIKGRFAKQEEVDALKRQMKQELDDQK